MSYLVYRHLKIAENYLADKEAGIKEDYQDDKIYENIKVCFDAIYNVAKFNKKLYFDLKSNWALLRKHDYRQVLSNINEWLVKADDRYDGENWTEKVQSPKPTGELIVGEDALQEFYDIVADKENYGLIEHDNGVNFITGNELEFEIDEEDCNRILFDVCDCTIAYKYYKHGIKSAITEVLVEAGVTNFKIDERFGEIKFYH